MLPLGDKPVILRCLETLFAAGLQDVIVVLGPSGQDIEKVIKGLPVGVAWNNDPMSDMAGSVRIGLLAVPESARGILVCLADHPLVLPDTIKTILQCHLENKEQIIIPSRKGKRGHPTLFPLAVIEELSQVATLRDVVHKDPARVRLVEVTDPGIGMEMDTPADYQAILAAFQGASSKNQQ